MTVSLTFIVAGCGSSEPPYFEQHSSFAEGGSAITGTLVYVGMGVLEVHAGDHVRFLTLEAGSDARRVLVAPLRQTNGAIGMMRDHEASPADLAEAPPLP